MQHRGNSFKLLAFVLVMLALCAATAYTVTRLGLSGHGERPGPATHRWLHDELNLSADEKRQVDELDRQMQVERTRLEGDFEQAKRHLAELLQSEAHYSQEVTAAVQEIHVVHGALQDLAIRHYYDMLAVLPADKQARLRELAVEALSTPH